VAFNFEKKPNFNLEFIFEKVNFENVISNYNHEIGMLHQVTNKMARFDWLFGLADLARFDWLFGLDVLIGTI